MSDALISLGANLGDRIGTLESALDLLNERSNIQVTANSDWLRSTPAGGPLGQSEFVNAAARLETNLTPKQLLFVLQETEAQLGRTRDQRWEARKIDLDLLLYDDVILSKPELTLPHPRMTFRRFVLEPAAEIACEVIHPLLDRSLKQLLDHLNLPVDYIAVSSLLSGETNRDRVNKIVRQAAKATSTALLEDDLTVDTEEYIQRRSELLMTHQQPKMISNFWLGDSLINDSLKTDAPPPKLIILWKDHSSTNHTALQAPFLYLDLNDPDWAVEEITAAFNAMQAS